MSVRDFPRFMGERVLLRIPEPGDEVPILDFYTRNNNFLKPFDPPRPSEFFTALFWRRFVTQSRQEFTQGTACRFVVMCRKTPGRMIGKINFSQVARGPFQACYVGYAIDQDEQGQGKMREAANLAIAYMFDEWNLHRIMANYMPTNERSAHLLRRLGFAVEGYARDYLFINNEWRDHILTSLTHHDWVGDFSR